MDKSPSLVKCVSSFIGTLLGNKFDDTLWKYNMLVKVKFFASLVDYIGKPEVDLELVEDLNKIEIPNKCSLDDLKNALLKKRLC